MRALSPSEKVVSSLNTMPTAAPDAVSRTSPWKTGESVASVTWVPSARVAETLPSTVTTRPIGADSGPPAS